MRNSILQAWDQAYKSLADLLTPNKVAYCQQHNYTYSPFEGEAPKYWARHIQTLGTLPNFDWILSLDVDIVITNPDITLESIIGHHEEDLLVGSDCNGLNNGFMLWRNTDWSKDFINKWLADGVRYSHYPNPDQSALAYLLYLEPKTKWAILPQRACNSYCYVEYGLDYPEGEWQPRDFILHMPALSMDIRRRLVGNHM